MKNQRFQRLDQLQKTIELITNNKNPNNLDEAKGLLEIIKNYNKSFILLNQFDSNNLKTENLNENITYEIKFDEATKAIEELKTQLIKKKEAISIPTFILCLKVGIGISQEDLEILAIEVKKLLEITNTISKN